LTLRGRTDLGITEDFVVLDDHVLIHRRVTLYELQMFQCVLCNEWAGTTAILLWMFQVGPDVQSHLVRSNAIIITILLFPLDL
jgi:hypothetical protein